MGGSEIRLLPPTRRDSPRTPITPDWLSTYPIFGAPPAPIPAEHQVEHHLPNGYQQQQVYHQEDDRRGSQVSEVSSHASLMPDRTRQDSHMSDMQVSDIKSQETQQVKMQDSRVSDVVGAAEGLTTPV